MNVERLIELDAALKISLRNADQVNQDDLGIRMEGRRICLNLQPKDYKYRIANTCRGLLCLSEPSQNNPVAVCNPVTDEFINLPPTNDANVGRFIDCGLGFSPRTDRHKVIRVFTRDTLVVSCEDLERHDGAFPTYGGTIAEVYTLGTDSWRRVVKAPHTRYKLAFPTYHNGPLYCFCHRDHVVSEFIVSFNFDDEIFEPVPLLSELELPTRHLSMGVLGSDLFACDASEVHYVDIWVLKICSVSKSWTKLFLISKGVDELPFSLYRPIN